MKRAGIFLSIFLLTAILSGCVPGRTEAGPGTSETEALLPPGTKASLLPDGTELPKLAETGEALQDSGEIEAEAAQKEIPAETGAAQEEKPAGTGENQKKKLAETGAVQEEKTVEAGQKEALPEDIASYWAGPEPSTTVRADWSHYFGDLNGTAVIFDPDEHIFQIYNVDLADTRRSPCSTFKIISSLAGLEHGVIDPENSVRSWSGENFWNDDWNRDIDFYDAFRTSCVWYYRQVADDIGPDAMQDVLDTLRYGNCDISDWAGLQNINNRNPALTGFWIESSLKISPREQTEILNRIFGSTSGYSADTRAILEEVMLLSEESQDLCTIYGKTGMGKTGGVVVDAWYTGFADIGRRIYFCIYLGETAHQNVSSTRAREIAVSLIKENFRMP
ncbi:MAG: class D beta-lactamase [Lachnospiraceae bacterium]|jgi:beta-lactamase class D|nr:class D beta-lactamase [Lachnospiraceae bacterium]